GEPIGVLALFSKQSITPEEDAMLEGFAGTAAQVIQSGKAEQSLQEERARLINILESMGDGVYISNQTCDIEYVNPVIKREFGPINGRRCYEYFHDRDEVCPWCKSKEVFAGKTVRWEWHSSKNNKTYDLLETPLRNRDGTISKLEIFRDITERKYLENALEAKTDQLTVLIGAICYFLESGDWHKTSSMILRSALDQTDSEYGLVGVVMKGPVLRILAYQGIIWDKVKNVELYENAMRSFQDQGYIDFPWLDNLLGRVIKVRGMVVSNDPGNDPRAGHNQPHGHPPMRSFLGVPIFKGQDVIGMIGVANRKGGYTGEEQSRIEILCHATSVLYDSYLRHQKEAAHEEERKKQEEAIHHLAYYDMLTNLPNRLSLHDDIDRAISQARTENSPLALLIINLDRFEEINNTLGHDNGDLILQQMAIRLQGISGEPNRVAHLGGDVFAVLLKNTDAEGASKRAEKIIGAIKESIAIADLFIEVSASIGISLFPGHGADADTLIRRAEIAMYVAKRIESSLCIYSPKYDQYSQKRLALMGELRQAIEQDQMFLLYQPKI
ncbi:MAG: diguanylate cyclase, partial [Nitrospirota bacterium]